MYSVMRMALACVLAVGMPAVSPSGAATARSTDHFSCHGPARGRLLRTIALDHLERNEIAAELQENGLAGSASYGADRYRLLYCTVSPSGGTVVASGLLVLPQGAHGPLPLVAYAHGTLVTRTSAPSFGNGVEGRLAPMLFSAEGFAVAAPDYLGLGVS
jgi:hypothetical protein